MKKKILLLLSNYFLVIGGALLIWGVLFNASNSLHKIFYRNNNWFLRTGKMIETPLFYSQGIVFSEDEVDYKNFRYSVKNDELSAYNKQKGKEQWRVSLDNGYEFTTPLYVVSGRLYIGDTTGTLRVFGASSGKPMWTFFQSPGLPSKVKQAFKHVWFGKILFVNKLVVVGGRDGVITALFQKTGKVAWSLTVDGAVTALEKHGGMTVVASSGGEMAAISSDGQTKWRAQGLSESVSLLFSHKDSIVTWLLVRLLGAKTPDALAKKYLSVVSIDKAGNMSLRNMVSGKVYYERVLGSRPTSPPAAWSGHLFVGAQDKTPRLVNIDMITGEKAWEYESEQMFSAKPVIGYRNILLKPLCSSAPYFSWVSVLCLTTVFIGDEGGDIHAVRERSGAAAWKFHTTGPILSPVAVTDKHVVVGNLNGDVYTIFMFDGKIPKKIGWRTLELKQNTDTVSKSDILEITIRYKDDIVPYPGETVLLTSQFTHADGKTIYINGYYYDKNTWKIKFNPTDKGQWNYRVRLELPDSSTIVRSGAFVSNTSSKGQYLKAVRTPGGIGRLTADGHTAFPIIGIENVHADRNCNGNLLDDYFIGDVGTESETNAIFRCGYYPYTHSLEEYLNVYGNQSKTFNTLRWGVENASFPLLVGLNPGTYQQGMFEWKAGDRLAESVVAQGLHLWMTIFNNEIPNQTIWRNSPVFPFLAKRYIKDVVARYGAYVSVWELTNEAYAEDGLIDVLAQYLKSLDHESRPVTTSWEKAGLSVLDIISPHMYDSDNLNIDKQITDRIAVDGYSVSGKPIVFGEVGNKVSNWDEFSAVRMRVRAWTAVLNNVGLIFWNSSLNKKYVPGGNPNMNGNQYIGDVERGYMSVLNAFSKDIRIEAGVFHFDVDKGSIRSYGLVDNNGIYGYLYRYSNYQNNLPATVSFLLPKPGRFEWYDTKTGEIYSQARVGKGSHTITSPPFIIDIALRILFE